MSDIEPKRLRVAVPGAEPIEYLDFPDVPKNAPARPNKQYYVAALVAGTAIGIHKPGQYETFFKLFQRACENKGKKLRLVRRQVSESLWLLIPQKKNEPKPDSLINGAWREHGRYKYYAQASDRGESLDIEGEAEATKVRRAWMLYVKTDARNGRRCTIERVRGGKFRLTVNRI